MKYYLLQQFGADIKETGAQFQSTTGVVGDIQSEHLPSEGRINFDFKLPEPFLEKKAHPTTSLNVVMIPSWFLVLKDYFIDILNKYNIGEYQIWNIKVHKKDSILNGYKLFYLTTPIKSEIIDFENSLFYVGKWSDWKYKGETLNIEDNNKFFEIKNELTSSDFNINSINLQLNLSNIKYDICRIGDIPLVGGGYFVSEKLKKFIEEQKFTGFAFQEIEEMDKRIKVVY